MRPIVSNEPQSVPEFVQRQPFTIFNHNYLLGEKVASINGEVAAYARVKLLAEAILAFDPTINRLSRVRILQTLLEDLISMAHDSGLEQIHAFIENEEFARMLQNRFGFEPVVGVPLVLKLLRE